MFLNIDRNDESIEENLLLRCFRFHRYDEHNCQIIFQFDIVLNVSNIIDSFFQQISINFINLFLKKSINDEIELISFYIQWRSNSRIQEIISKDIIKINDVIKKLNQVLIICRIKIHDKERTLYQEFYNSMINNVNILVDDVWKKFFEISSQTIKIEWQLTIKEKIMCEKLNARKTKQIHWVNKL